MKNVLFKRMAIVMVFAIAVTSCGGNNGNNSEMNANDNEKATATQTISNKKLPFERGSYVQVTKAMGIEIPTTVYFDKWGDWTATETKIEIIKGYPSHTIEIIKGKTHWNIDLIERTGTQYEAAGFSTGMAAALGASMGQKMAKDMEIEELGTEDFLGYKSKKIRVKYKDMDMDVTTWNYDNLTMKMTGSMGKMDMFSEILSIDLSAPPASIFEVPDDVKIEVQKF
ncbi:MAG: hypothetical protein FWE63_05040 [Bacteroidales bacterium]|nr:hypothetical protein [Bacteroidales bacterium]